MANREEILLEQRKKELAQKRVLIEKQQAMEEAKEKDIQTLRRQGPVLFLGPIFPCLMCLFTITFGSAVLNFGVLDCGYPLGSMLVGDIMLSYALLGFVGYLYIGPWPIKQLKYVKWFYVLFVLAGSGWYGIQTIYFMMSRSCMEKAPMLYFINMVEIALYLGGVFLALVYAVKYKCDETSRKMRAIKEEKQKAIKHKQALSQFNKRTEFFYNSSMDAEKAAREASEIEKNPDYAEQEKQLKIAKENIESLIQHHKDKPDLGSDEKVIEFEGKVKTLDKEIEAAHKAYEQAERDKFYGSDSDDGD